MRAHDAALLVAAGFAGGLINAIAGGGSLLVFPALVGTGLSTVAANVTNSVALWPGYIGNILGLGRLVIEAAQRHSNLAWVAAAGSAAGSALLLLTPARAFALIVPVLVALAALLVGLQPRIARWIGAQHTARPTTLALVLAIASLYGGYFGGGLGVILLAAIGLTMQTTMREMNVLKALLQFVVSTVSLVAFVFFAPVHWAQVAVIAPAALAGGVAGGRLARVVSDGVLRVAVVVFGLAIAVWLGVRAY